MSGNTKHRDEGVDFTRLNALLKDISYPISKEQFVREYQDHAIERTNAGPITIEELFAGTGDDHFETDNDIRHSVLNLMPKESVGRQRYSDRGGSGPKEVPDQVGKAVESF